MFLNILFFINSFHARRSGLKHVLWGCLQLSTDSSFRAAGNKCMCLNPKMCKWKSKSCSENRSRKCLPFCLRVFVTNFNNFWHSIHFSPYKDTRLLKPVFLPCVEISWILSRKNGLTSHWQWKLQMASRFNVALFFSLLNQAKQIDNVSFRFHFTFFSLLSDLFANTHFLCFTETQSNLLNGMQKLTFAVLFFFSFLGGIAWLFEICNMLFAFRRPFGPLKTPPFQRITVHTYSKHQSDFLTPWQDLTFKWQLLNDLFGNLYPCFALPTGRKSGAQCP